MGVEVVDNLCRGISNHDRPFILQFPTLSIGLRKLQALDQNVFVVLDKRPGL